MTQLTCICRIKNDPIGNWQVVDSPGQSATLRKTTLGKMKLPNGALAVDFAVDECCSHTTSQVRNPEPLFTGARFSIAHSRPSVGFPVDVPGFIGREIFKAIVSDVIRPMVAELLKDDGDTAQD